MEIAIWGFAGVLVGSLVTIISTWWTTRQTISSENRKEWRNYLMRQMDILVKARAEFDAFLSENSDELEKIKRNELKLGSWKKAKAKVYGRIIGDAISACLATADKKLIMIAQADPEEDKQNTLTPYFVNQYEDAKSELIWRQRNREKLKEAINRLAELIYYETKGKPFLDRLK